MNIRSAILAAADHIEANPGEFNYQKNRIPPECGTPGCALGWIGHFYGIRNGYAMEYVLPLLGLSHLREFSQERMDAIDRGIRRQANSSSLNWRSDAAICARTLRVYANAYHPASPSLDPAYVSWRDALKRENGYQVAL